MVRGHVLALNVTICDICIFDVVLVVVTDESVDTCDERVGADSERGDDSKSREFGYHRRRKVGGLDFWSVEVPLFYGSLMVSSGVRRGVQAGLCNMLWVPTSDTACSRRHFGA